MSINHPRGHLHVPPHGPSYRTKCLSHMSEQADPSPGHSSNLALIGHREIIDLVHRYRSNEPVQVSLHLAEDSISLSSIWGPCSPHIPQFSIRMNRPYIWFKSSKHVSWLKHHKKKSYILKNKNLKTYLYRPTMQLLEEGDPDLLGSPCLHNSTHWRRMWPESTNQKSPRHSDEEVHLQGGTTVKSTFSSKVLSEEKEEGLPLGQGRESSRRRMSR